jgi:hypothetical protein
VRGLLFISDTLLFISDTLKTDLTRGGGDVVVLCRLIVVIDRKGPPRDLQYHGISKVVEFHEEVLVERGRCEHQLELPLGVAQPEAEEAQQQVDVDAALVHLVDDDVVVL